MRLVVFFSVAQTQFAAMRRINAQCDLRRVSVSMDPIHITSKCFYFDCGTIIFR